MDTTDKRPSAVSQIAGFLHVEGMPDGGPDVFWQTMAARFPNATISEAFQAMAVARRVLLDEIAEAPAAYRQEVAEALEALDFTAKARAAGWRRLLALAWQSFRGKP